MFRISYFDDDRVLHWLELKAGDRCLTISGKPFTVKGIGPDSVTYENQSGTYKVSHEHAVSMLRIGAWIRES